MKLDCFCFNVYENKRRTLVYKNTAEHQTLHVHNQWKDVRFCATTSRLNITVWLRDASYQLCSSITKTYALYIVIRYLG